MEGLAAALRRHRSVGLDTSVFIYHIEGSSKYASPAGLVFGALASGVFAGVTSVLTLMELTVRPLQLGKADVAAEYEALVASFPNLSVVDLDRSMARRAAELRAIHRLRPADALQLAALRAATAMFSSWPAFTDLAGKERIAANGRAEALQGQPG